MTKTDYSALKTHLEKKFALMPSLGKATKAARKSYARTGMLGILHSVPATRDKAENTRMRNALKKGIKRAQEGQRADIKILRQANADIADAQLKMFKLAARREGLVGGDPEKWNSHYRFLNGISSQTKEGEEKLQKLPEWVMHKGKERIGSYVQDEMTEKRLQKYAKRFTGSQKRFGERIAGWDRNLISKSFFKEGELGEKQVKVKQERSDAQKADAVAKARLTKEGYAELKAYTERFAPKYSGYAIPYYWDSIGEATAVTFKPAYKDRKFSDKKGKFYSEQP